MYGNIGDFYIENGQKYDASKFEFDLTSDQIIYEVLRVINGKMLFLKDHMDRLRTSLRRSNFNIEVVDSIEEDLDVLVKGHQGLSKNIKIDVCENRYRLYFMESSYPELHYYENGVATTLYHFNRIDPEIKQLNMTYKKKIEMIKSDRFFEVLLTNDNNEVIEGSRSNLLFVKNNILISAPLDQILNGITFKNVLKMADKLNIEVSYKNVRTDELQDMDACFLTGTSLGVLPISSIDHYNFDSSEHAVVKKLIKTYNDTVL